MRWATAVGFAVGMLMGGCSTAEVTPSASVTTLMADAERWFKLSYGEPAGKLQLLALALDANGNVVAQRIEWVPGVARVSLIWKDRPSSGL